MKMGKLFLMALQDQHYSGHIYPVHPEAEEIDGLKAYSSVSAIPGQVDLAIILVPHHRALPPFWPQLHGPLLSRKRPFLFS
ncbi:MAG: hypothetical protein B1H13_09555 [Desulfobacteraceae bacterium 4484_190.3]|nr:MAG: hypothetical protein B1H13_09555 [Desulfobacteraceae bacterium 4484_190.3]